jgi:hypothetical protein
MVGTWASRHGGHGRELWGEGDEDKSGEAHKAEGDQGVGNIVVRESGSEHRV